MIIDFIAPDPYQPVAFIAETEYPRETPVSGGQSAPRFYRE